MKKYKNKLLGRNESGQALFEFIFFLPFMIIFYTTIVHIAGAINGSINQQKVVRNIFFARLKGNPTVPAARLAVRLAQDQNVQYMGMYSFIWAVRAESSGVDQTPIAACYNIPIYGIQDPEECDTARPDPDDNSSPNVIVKTGFGICGMSYRIDPQNGFVRDYTDRVTSAGGCTNTTQ